MLIIDFELLEIKKTIFPSILELDIFDIEVTRIKLSYLRNELIRDSKHITQYKFATYVIL